MSGLESLREDELLKRVAKELLGGGVGGWLVGGAVRDAIIHRVGRPDLDLVVPRGALEVTRKLADVLGGAFVALDEAREIGRIALGEGAERCEVDVASLRAPTVEEDLLRRDFAVNAIAVELKELVSPEIPTPVIIDPAGGREDLEARLIRVPSDEVLDDDPLRLLRAFRLAAELCFTIDPGTRVAIEERVEKLREMAGERIRGELFTLLSVSPSWPWMEELADSGVMAVLAPEHVPMVDLDQGRHHESTLWLHSLATLRHLEEILSHLSQVFHQEAEELEEYFAEPLEAGVTRQALTKWAALWHDVGKPDTKTVDRDGEIRFFGHEKAGAEIIMRMARRLQLGRRAKTFLHIVVTNHMRPLHLSKAEIVTRRACYRFFRDLKDAAQAVCLVALADARATRKGGALARDVEGVVETLLSFRKEREAKPAPQLVNGDDLMARYGLARGPLIGRLLAMVEEAGAVGEVATKEEAFSYLDARRAEWEKEA
jgi:putative nucleotidyltransferase with HDIG domain